MKCLFAVLMLVSTSAWAVHGLSMGQAPLYGAGFAAFPYVNAHAPKGGMLTLPVQGGFDSLNPFTLKGDHEAGVTMLTLDTLMVRGENEPFAMYGLLANDVQLASDGLSVTFKLNPKARFHNGDPVLAQDVAQSFKLLTQDKAATPMYRFYWADVDKVETPAPHTVIFRFKQHNSELHMILGELPVFSRKSYPKGLGAAPNTPPIGSGPYVLSKAEDGRLSVFSRVKNYWAQNLNTRKGMFNFDTIRFKYFQDDSVRIEGIKGGQYDFAQENIARNWARAYPESMLAKRGLQKHEWPQSRTAGMQGFVMNLRRAPLNNILVRRALVESFDFESVNRRQFYNLYRRSNSFFTNSEMAATGKPIGAELALLNSVRDKLPATVFNENVPEPPQIDPIIGVRANLLKARALLLQAGFRYRNGALVGKNNQPLSFTLLVPSKTYERVTAKWQRDLAKIGIQLNVRIADPAVYQKRMNDFDFDLAIVMYGNSESPGNEQLDYFSCQAAKTTGSRNYAGVCNSAVEQLLKPFLHFKNRAELITAARALDRVIRHQYIIVPNWYANQYRVIYRDTIAMPAQTPKYYSPMQRVIEAGWAR